MLAEDVRMAVISFHSLEDNEHGFLKGAQINLGSLSARITEDESLKFASISPYHAWWTEPQKSKYLSNSLRISKELSFSSH